MDDEQDIAEEVNKLVDKRNAKRERRQMYAPWGGIFDKDKEPEVFPVLKAGSA